MRNKQGNRPDQLWTTILPERSDITWAGPHDVAGQFCFGTENGSVFWTNESGKLISGLSAASRDREAINGVAFNARDMVVTTRSDCCYWTRPQLGSVLQKITGEQFGYGSHGVVNGINNDFFLPCGHNGMMRLSRTKDHSPNSWIVSSDDADINCYSVASFEGSDGDQLIASALRKTGIAVGKVDIANPISLHTMSITSDDDFINFSIIGGDKTPNSAYALTRDGTIFLYNNICQPDLFSAANFKELVRGSYQRILVVGNYTFVLSSDGLLIFKHFFVRSGHNIIPNSIINYAVYELADTVDMNIVSNRWLLIVMPTGVLRLDLRALRNLGLESQKLPHPQCYRIERSPLIKQMNLSSSLVDIKTETMVAV